MRGRRAMVLRLEYRKVNILTFSQYCFHGHILMSLFLCRYENWEATIGFPPAYDWEPCKYEGERGHVESMASMAELDQRGHFLQYMVSLEGSSVKFRVLNNCREHVVLEVSVSISKSRDFGFEPKGQNVTLIKLH